MNESIQRSLAPRIVQPGIRYRSYYDRKTQTYRDGPTFGETFQAQFAYSYDPFYERAKLFFDNKAQEVDELFDPTKMPNYNQYKDFSDTLNKANNEYHYLSLIHN